MFQAWAKISGLCMRLISYDIMMVMVYGIYYMMVDGHCMSCLLRLLPVQERIIASREDNATFAKQCLRDMGWTALFLFRVFLESGLHYLL
jgi:hypothetical protein